jgi:hypothetical protein
MLVAVFLASRVKDVDPNVLVTALAGVIAALIAAGGASAAVVISARTTRRRVEGVHEEVRTGNGQSLGATVYGLKSDVADLRIGQEQQRMYQELHDGDDERRFAVAFEAVGLDPAEARSTRRLLERADHPRTGPGV